MAKEYRYSNTSPEEQMPTVVDYADERPRRSDTATMETPIAGQEYLDALGSREAVKEQVFNYAEKKLKQNTDSLGNYTSVKHIVKAAATRLEEKDSPDPYNLTDQQLLKTFRGGIDQLSQLTEPEMTAESITGAKPRTKAVRT